MLKQILWSLGLLFAATVVFAAGMLLGAVWGQYQERVNRFEKEQEVIARVLVSDPAWSKVSSGWDTGDGMAMLFGDVKTKDDHERLRSRMKDLFGETRIESLIGGVRWLDESVGEAAGSEMEKK